MILLTRRAAGQKLAGYWEFPGGKLEPGEDPQSCIERELEEELGVQARAREEVIRSTYRYSGGAIELIAIRVDIASTDFTLTVHDAVEWVSKDELLEMKLAPADVAVAEFLVPSSGIPQDNRYS